MLTFIFIASFLRAEDGYELWLRYKKIDDTELLDRYQSVLHTVSVPGSSSTCKVIREELKAGFSDMLDMPVDFGNASIDDGLLVITSESSALISKFNLSGELHVLGSDGYLIRTINDDGKKLILLASANDVGALYGTFHFLRLLQMHSNISKLDISEKPKTTHRLLNHWDNLDRTVERGYAGFSIWDWHKLPDFISPQYKDYARANASIGINGTVLTNVNANALILKEQYLEKIAALANVFRPYGIKVYLTARFSAPVEIGGLETADPLNEDVAEWWNSKAEEIYRYVPDFGGFLVKANSEGQPGPQDYDRSHADGANMLARAVAPFGGVVMWRAFVYSHETPVDRALQAYDEFKPLDGEFEDNVFVQVKNGAIDFQPREPFHPLFGGMEHTPLMMEFQITQEYLGCATHLVYLAPLFKETLNSDTYANGKGSTVAKVVDGSLYEYEMSGMAGVSNIGTDRNWTGHPFGQSNWYAYGRLAWDHTLSSDEIAEEWLKMTFTTEMEFIDVVKPLMLNSRETAVNYMTPLGLHHQMAWNHHWGPGPWVNIDRPDWTSLYYHRADSAGIGFDRSVTGSNAVSQYHPKVRDRFNNIETCSDEFLLWFHHVPWDYKMKSGNTLWEEMCKKYYSGAHEASEMVEEWETLKSFIDARRHDHVAQLLRIQEKEAMWWRNAMLLYFQQFSGMPIPDQYEQPDKTLEYYQNLEFHFVPGIENN